MGLISYLSYMVVFLKLFICTGASDELEIDACFAPLRRFFFVSGCRPIMRAGTPIVRPFRAPFERTIPQCEGQHPTHIIAMIAGQAKPRAIDHDTGQLGERFRRDDASTMMPTLRPGVRKQNETPFYRSVWQRFDEKASVSRVNPDVLDVRYFHGSDQAGHTVNKGFAADEAYLCMHLSLRRKMLAAAKPDFEPYGFHWWIEQRVRFVETFE
jgi:hypothetical protein